MLLVGARKISVMSSTVCILVQRSTVRYGRVICDYIEVTAHPSHMITPASEADDQMRRRFQQLLPNCPLSALYAINVFGSISCIYRHTPFSNGIEPPLPPVCYRHRSAYDMRDSKIIMAVWMNCVGGSVEVSRLSHTKL